MSCKQARFTTLFIVLVYILSISRRPSEGLLDVILLDCFVSLQIFRQVVPKSTVSLEIMGALCNISIVPELRREPGVTACESNIFPIMSSGLIVNDVSKIHRAWYSAPIHYWIL